MALLEMGNDGESEQSESSGVQDVYCGMQPSIASRHIE